MYPFKYKTSIVRNRWYIAAFSTEISRKPMERTIHSIPVLMYRKEDGTPVAMYGLCPHRYFSLVKGTVEGDNIVCGYHGFKFADNGDCVDIPSQDAIPKNFCQPVYPLEERGPICWIWMGDLDKCDTALIPPYDDFGLDNKGSYYSSENYFHVQGRPHLLVDNLMDLTHLPYIHKQLGKGGDTLKKIPMETEEREKSYRVLRKGKMPWNPFLEIIFGKEVQYEGLADFVHLSDFYGPELVKTSMPTITKIPGRDDLPKGLGHMAILHGITPETETSTHYFGFSTRNFRQGDATLDRFQFDSEMEVRRQDVDAIEDMEKRIDQAAKFQKELIVVADKAAIQARRKVDAMLAAENKPTENK